MAVLLSDSLVCFCTSDGGISIKLRLIHNQLKVTCGMFKTGLFVFISKKISYYSFQLIILKFVSRQVIKNYSKIDFST